MTNREQIQADLEEDQNLLKECQAQLKIETDLVAQVNIELQIKQSRKNIAYYKKQLKELKTNATSGN